MNIPEKAFILLCEKIQYCNARRMPHRLCETGELLLFRSYF